MGLARISPAWITQPHPVWLEGTVAPVPRTASLEETGQRTLLPGSSE